MHACPIATCISARPLLLLVVGCCIVTALLQLQDLRKDEDPRLSFSTPEFKEAQVRMCACACMHSSCRWQQLQRGLITCGGAPWGPGPRAGGLLLLGVLPNASSTGHACITHRRAFLCKPFLPPCYMMTPARRARAGQP